MPRELQNPKEDLKQKAKNLLTIGQPGSKSHNWPMLR